MKGYSVAVGVAIDEIDADLRPARHMRVRLDEEAIAEYAGSIDEMPEVKLFVDDSGHHWVVDGAHTISAARKAGRRDIQAIVKHGTYLDAWKEAADANRKHGVRVTNADKHHRVDVALKDPVMKTWSNRRIAEWCAVSHKMVNEMKPELEPGSSSDPPKTVGRDGKARRAPKPKKPRKPRSTPASQPAPTGGNGPSREDIDEMFTSDVAEPGPAEFDPDSAWEQVERFVMSEFESWPDDYKAIFKDNLDSLGYRLSCLTPGWSPPITVEVDGG